ncbi:MAG: ABC transporter permease [Pirellulaceae bacterium]|nr:ABC transporter permease [Pirellulaceae bacterium]
MLTRYGREVSIAAALIGLLAIVALFAPAFFRPEHVRDKLVANAPVLVAAIGMTLVIMARQIDISIGSQYSVCGVVSALAAAEGWPLPLVICLSIGTGALMGLVNGYFVAYVKLPAIVVTLATMVIFREALRWWREGEFVRGLQDHLQWFGADQWTGQWIIVGVSSSVLLSMAIWLRSARSGRSVLAVGSNQEAARLVGIRPQRVLLAVFVLMGGLTGLAALLGAARFGDIDPNAGSGLELQVIAAVVIGGTAIAGGRGSMIGTLLGVALLGLIGPTLVFLHIQPQWEKALQGVIILAAVASESIWQVRPARKRSQIPPALPGVLPATNRSQPSP